MDKGPQLKNLDITAKVIARCFKDKLLLIRRDKHHIEFPGGGSQPCDENDPLTIALREFEEETGIALERTRLIQVSYQYKQKDDHHWYCFEVELCDEDFRACRLASSEGRVVLYNITDLLARNTVAKLPLKHQAVLKTLSTL